MKDALDHKPHEMMKKNYKLPLTIQ